MMAHNLSILRIMHPLHMPERPCGGPEKLQWCKPFAVPSSLMLK